jgi:hypothetical protein
MRFYSMLEIRLIYHTFNRDPVSPHTLRRWVSIIESINIHCRCVVSIVEISQIHLNHRYAALQQNPEHERSQSPLSNRSVDMRHPNHCFSATFCHSLRSCSLWHMPIQRINDTNVVARFQPYATHPSGFPIGCEMRGFPVLIHAVGVSLQRNAAHSGGCCEAVARTVIQRGA